MEEHEPAVYRLPRGCETILVGVDDERLRARVRIALEACGYDVMETRTGAEALRIARRYRPSISLLICQLARLSERLAASAAGRGQPARRRRLRVLLLADDCGAAAHAGDLSACLQLPIRPSALVARVRQILDSEPRKTAGPDRIELQAAPPNGGSLEC